MEQTHDWRNLQPVFYPRRRSLTRQSGEPSGPIYAVVEGATIVAAFADCEDVSDWQGASLDEMAAELPHRKLVTFSREQVESWLEKSSELPHFHAELEALREKALAEGVVHAKGGKAHALDEALVFKPHFLLDALQGWWTRVLPTSYGIFIRLEGQPSEEILLIMRRGKLQLYQKPEFTSLGPERVRQPEDVVKYLSEKHMLPVQGIFVSAREWAEWTEMGHPWRKIFRAVTSRRAKLVPYRWDVLALLLSRSLPGG